MTARILSLVPAATDWVVDLGLADRLVGVTHECDVPDGLDPEVVVTPAVAPDPSDPEGIDAAVSATAADDQPLYRIDDARVAALGPTLVLNQRLCEVCAVSPTQAEQVAAEAGAQVLTLSGVTLEGLLGDARRLGDALGASDRAERLVEELRRRLDAVAEAVRGRPARATAVVEWPAPVWVAGHWVPDQVAVAGGHDVAGASGAPSRRGTWAELAGAEVTVLGPCGYDLETTLAHAPAFVPDDRDAVWAMDADRELSRPSAGAVDGVETLARILHPDVLGPPEPHRARPVRAASVPR